MAIIPVSQEDIEVITTAINPIRTYSSSSSGVTGSIRIFPRSTDIEKEIRPLENFAASALVDDDIEAFREDLAVAAVNIVNISGSIQGQLEEFLQKVNEQPSSIKKKKVIDINRFTPSVKLTANTLRKWHVKDMLMNYYRGVYPSADWAYSNYSCLNFFTSSKVPSTSVLMYPSIDRPNVTTPAGYVSGAYSLSGAFSFDFYINPKYKLEDESFSYKAGTIFHLSSSYALSLVTGSKKDENGIATGYRLLLQLSHSADISPSEAVQGTYPKDLVFYSDDNSLEWNKWHRVVVRWGTDAINEGTGSFNIDGVDKGIFVIPSGTIMPKIFPTKDDPRVLCVGNFYEGTNFALNSQLHFFSDIPAKREGLSQLLDNASAQDEPFSYKHDHPLSAELHELIIRRYYMDNPAIKRTYGKGMLSDDLTEQDIAFYLPVLFVEKTPIRRFTSFPAGSSYGGILQTPFFEIDGSTDDPFNVSLAFGVAGHYINLENFVKDFANNVWPRLHHLSGTAITTTTTARPANDFLYDDSRVRKRNLSILPCDNGSFLPNYSLLSDQIGNKYVDTFGRYDPSVINLNNLLNEDSLLMGSTHDTEKDESFIEQLLGYTPENPNVTPGPAVQNFKNSVESLIATDEGSYGPGVQKSLPLAIYQRTKDSSSDQVTFFDISNIFYGDRILPGSFVLTDSNISGSGGAVSITLRDDGYGNLYRADSIGTHSQWNSVGNIFYDEGVVVVKSPHLYFFGKESYSMSFKGLHNLHSMKFEILAPTALLNSSSNPSYAPLKETIRASGDPVDNDVFVYISGLNLHDENLNVVAKAVVAQPALKREGEKILFKVAFDF